MNTFKTLLLSTVLFSPIACGKNVDVTKDVPTRISEQVFFEFDSPPKRGNFKLNEKQKETCDIAIQKTQSKNCKILIEGHCDSRGTDKYNNALGERRVKVVKDYLIQKGINKEDIQTTSYGKQKQPYPNAQNDSEHAMNRVSLILET